ncbi:MAG: VWA domain-containing protein [Salinisphaera sp.]|nr:VWA domain-containing protein [Salinisphaera sp.]
MSIKLSIVLIAAALTAAACQSAQRAAPSTAHPPSPVADAERAVPPPGHQPRPQIAAKRQRLAESAIAFSYAGHGRALAIRPMPAPPPNRMYRENYEHPDSNPVHLVAKQPVSTFSVDVDTASYANVRRMLEAGRLPPQAAVRVEELINYFDYHYAVPRNANRPFGVTVAMAPTPWNSNTQLLQIGIQGWKPTGEPPPANLVFLVDVSGSMRPQNKLPLLKSSLKLMVEQLRPQDHVSLVTYAGTTRVALEPTPGDQKARIIAAINGLGAGGSTNGEAGIQLAYNMARQGFIEHGINRVLLATDGDFNVGVTSFEALIDLAERKRDTGVALTTLGFGAGNLNDHLMEQLADAGDGNYAYIDSLAEAQRVLVKHYAATTRTIARDVKVQIEFNPTVVREYRLIGYANRMLEREDFNNDNVDAGDIGAGHTVTALYEIALAGSGGAYSDPLRYRDGAPEAPAKRNELAFLRLRYKAPDGEHSQLIERPIERSQSQPLAQTSDAFRFAAAVAAFGQLLRGGKYTGSYTYQDVLALARNARASDAGGRRGEFVQLVQLADGLGNSITQAKR